MAGQKAFFIYWVATYRLGALVGDQKALGELILDKRFPKQFVYKKAYARGSGVSTKTRQENLLLTGN